MSSGSSSFFTCPICMTDYSPKESFTLACGHMFCKECMSQYVTVAISGGPACTVLACPENKCNSKVTSDIVHAVCPRLAPKWYSFMLRSFVDQNRSAKWCPQKNCDSKCEY